MDTPRMLSDEERRAILEDAVQRDLAVRGGTVTYWGDFQATIRRRWWRGRRSNYRVDPSGALLVGGYQPSRFVH